VPYAVAAGSGLNEVADWLSLVLPDQLASDSTTVPAVPADQVLGAPVPVMEHAAATASRLPATLGHVHVKAEAFRPGADLQAFPLPARAVSMTRADQRMRDFVKQGIANHLIVVTLDEMNGKLDAFAAEVTESHLLLSPIEGKRPVVQAVRRKKLGSEPKNLLGMTRQAFSGYG